MNVSRIEVPLALPEPHFEDEATVVSARQVVPLEQARVQNRRRKLFAILPILLAATFCGGLAAIAVNYFERRSSAPAISQPPTTSYSTEEHQQVTPVASPENRTATSTVEESDTAQPSGSALATDSPAAADSLASSNAAKSEETATLKESSSSTDPKQLVRARRVHPPSGPPRSRQNDQPKSKGAARIQDIFSGPNP